MAQLFSLGVMATLQEIVLRLTEFDPHQTIYAADPWQASSPVVIAYQRGDGLTPPEAVASGCRYFLEIDIALDVLRHYPMLLGREPSNLERCLRVIEYAENDA